ncbi:MAG: dihydroorotate dehydrogenase electron transfer subunit [Candidatus Omnitrophica bacterium]|nr:dihydroorotate dehydrogenase electron transfer subunit [Candidatus Omnitrophota bacterium]
MKRLQCGISENEKIAQSFYKMRVESLYLARNSKPGQFIEVQCSDGIEPLLRRPLGVHRILKNGIDLLYEVVGKGTAMLSEKKAGEEIDLIGPLGNGFMLNEKTILVAGGIGIAPLLALAEQLAYSKKQKIHVFIGAKTKEHIICAEDFKKIGCDVSVSTEDGSRGYKGLVTNLLNKLFDDETIKPSNDTTIYACGPVGMLKTVARIAKTNQIPCQVSLEERMACGVGVCLGCPVKVKGGEYKMVCKDGPVFNAEEIAW